MAVGQAGLCRPPAALLVGVEWKSSLVLALIPLLNMAEDLALGQGERNRHVARTLAQVSTFGLAIKI